MSPFNGKEKDGNQAEKSIFLQNAVLGLSKIYYICSSSKLHAICISVALGITEDLMENIFLFFYVIVCYNDEYKRNLQWKNKIRIEDTIHESHKRNISVIL